MCPDAPLPQRGATTDAGDPLLALQRRLSQTQRLAALGALVARLAHEVGTPLHSVGGHLDLLERDPSLGDDQRRRVRIVAGEVQRLSQLIRRYLQRLKAPEPQPTLTDMPQLVDSVCEVLEPVFARRGIRVGVEWTEPARAPFACDAEQVEQVILNLLQNAVDAMPEGGSLTIRGGHTAQGRSLSVADSGTGIAPDALDHVFEPFFTTKSSGRGSGLGLAICREIARAHGGDLMLDSRPGIGTVVTFTLEDVSGSPQ